MDYAESVQYINGSYEKKGVKHPLDEIKKILGRLGHPEDKLKIIHVAGTNGKGSACAMLTSVLTEAGYSVGTFTSPHLSRYNERIKLNGADIPDTDFAEQASAVRGAEEELSFFEILTLMAFNYFYERRVDYAVIEVGLGGKFCPTNVTVPLLSVITKIGFDHMNYLGWTIESIASEKAGIIKKNSDAVLYLNSREVYNVVKETADSQNAGLVFCDDYDYTIVERTTDETVFDVRSGSFKYDGLRLKMIGDYQVYNACNLLYAIGALNRLGVNIREEHIRNGLAKARWPGRMEIIKKEPVILLDGAHNADGAFEFNRAVGNYFPGRRIILVTGMLRDKEYYKILRVVTERAARVILTKPVTKRALDPEELAAVYDRESVPYEIEPDYKKAVTRAVSEAGKDGVVCVTGSLYLVADARRTILNGGDAITV